MTTSINGKVIGAVDLDPVDVSLDSIREEVLAAIANAGVPGEIKLVQNATGIAPAGTTKIESIVPDPTYNWLASGEYRLATLPKAFIVADAPNVKYVQAYNANEDFITTTNEAGGSVVKRFMTSSAYAPSTITLSGGSANVGSNYVYGFTDTGYFTYANAGSMITGFYTVAPLSTTSVYKSTASFTGFGSNRANICVANMGSTLILFNGSTVASPSGIGNLNSAAAWELNPVTNAVTALPAPPFLCWQGGTYTCTFNNELYVVLGTGYSEDGTTFIPAASVDAIPVYKLSANRVWSKIGNLLSPYTSSLAGVQTKGNQCRPLVMNGYLYLFTSIGTVWPSTVSLSIVRISLTDNSTNFVELTITGMADVKGICLPQTSYAPKIFNNIVVTTDGSKVYGAITGSSNAVVYLANVVNAQPVTTFYVKKS